jgi:hypothetical protein
MSKLFRTKERLTLAELARAWSSELVESAGDPKQCERDLIHVLQEDILNGRLDDSGPLRNGRRLGLRCIRPDNKAGLIEGRELLEFLGPGQAWVLDYVLITKEAVLDFAKRHELPPPSWWAEPGSTPTEVPNDTRVIETNTGAAPSRSLGKQPRILKYLSERFPDGVPEPGLCPRHTLKSDILEWDPRLGALTRPL